MPTEEATQRLIGDIDGQIEWYREHYQKQRRCHHVLISILIICAAAAPMMAIGVSSSTEAAANAIASVSDHARLTGQSVPKIDLTTFGIPNKIVAYLTACLSFLGVAAEAVRRYTKCSEKYARYYLAYLSLGNLKSNLLDRLDEIEINSQKPIRDRARRILSEIVTKETQDTFDATAKAMGYDMKFEVADTALDEVAKASG